MANRKADILISIKPVHMNNIVKRTKDHEFRKYLIKSNVERMWFYTSSPESVLQYIAVISKGKKVGDITDETGLGNAEFNKGIKESKFGYEIIHLYELHKPLKIKDLKSRYSISAPQKYTFATAQLLKDVVLEDQKKLF